jgi:2-amino-4-hydroxy-6-hydroxymethyldihydropteridine diphosphokinase
MKHIIYLGLGSNVGAREAYLEAAIEFLQPKVRILALSPIYETEPWGYTDQDDFLNQVVKAETDLSPEELLAHVKAVEIQAGRKPSFRYGPREIDVDILFYDNVTLDAFDLSVPHPRVGERAFMLVPLADLTPDLVHPTHGRTISELLEEVDKTGVKPHKD